MPPCRPRDAARHLPIVAMLAACATTTPRPAFDAALDGEPPVAVAGRNGWRPGQTLRFAEFAALDISRGAIRTGARDRVVRGAPAQDLARRQRYEFAMRAADDSGRIARVACESAMAERTRPVLRAIATRDAYRQTLGCTIAVPDGARWRLAVEETDSTAMTGALTRVDGQGAPFAVRPVKRTVGALLDEGSAVGFEFALDGRALGAVDVTGPGAVVLPQRYGADVRRLLAAASAALLLRDDLDTPATTSDDRRR